MNTAPHFGHLIFVFLSSCAHPKPKIDKATNTIKILTHFLITLHLLSSMDTIAPVLKNHIQNSIIQNKRITKIPPLCQEKNKRVGEDFEISD